MVGALARCLSCFDKIVAIFFFKVLPEILRLIVLAVCICWKYYRHVSSNYKYASTINKKSSRFSCRKRGKVDLAEECSICLSEFKEGEECRELVDCKHAFHRHCLERWLQGYKGTCPLCRNLVVPDVILAEYHRMQFEKENNNRIETELALILLNALHGGICYGYS